jgi:succinyl-diaminopimelate desuccinylase
MKELNLISKLISFDTQSHKNNKEIVGYIASLFPTEFITLIPLKNGDLDLYNLELKINGKSDQNPLIFSGHTDTVPTSSKWTRDPFQAKLVDGKVYGLGSSDMKAGVAAMILLAQWILDNKIVPENDIYFLFDCDEEVDGTGGKDFASRHNFTNASVIVAEPTNCELQVGQKGVFELKVTVLGQAFHSSTTSLEKNRKFNAIHKAMAIIQELEKLEEKFEQNKDELFNTPTQAVCTIQGGTAPNVIPDKCQFSLNRRVLPNENIDEVIAEFKQTIFSVDNEAIIEVGFSGNANLVDQDSDFMKECIKVSEKVLGEAKISVMTGWTQAGLFNKWGNCLIWGPGDMTMAHQADEYCPLDQIGAMVECYKRLVISY